MDLLKSEKGATIIETLVAIILLGLIITISFTIFVRLYGNKTLLYKQEAFQLANQEIINCMNTKIVSDTTYTNKNGNLLIERKINKQSEIYKVIINVNASSDNKNIVTLITTYVK